MLRKIVLSLVMVLTTSSALYAECSQTETFELKQCLQGEYQKADKELNAVYGQTMAKLDAEGKEALKKAQRAWIQFRDADAAFCADRFRGGTYAGAASLECLRDLTNQRVKDLKAESNMGAQ